MKRERCDVAYRRKMRLARSIGLSLEMALDAIGFDLNHRPSWWTYLRDFQEAA